MLTGLYPHNHGAVAKGKVKDFRNPSGYKKMRDDVVTLPEIMHILGYRTHFSTAVYLACAPLGNRVAPRLYSPSANAADMLNGLVEWIDRGKGTKYFAYVHLADLHTPLEPPESFGDYFASVQPLPNIERWDYFTREQQLNDAEGFNTYRWNRELLYDNTLRYVDHSIERLFDGLRARGLLESTLVIITADHGEEFWDHAEIEARSFYHQKAFYGFGHGHSLFNELIEVPLLMSGPLANSHRTYPVSSVDITPTIFDILGIRHSLSLDGCSLFQLQDNDRPLLSEASGTGYEKKSLVFGRYKLIVSKDDEVEWVFDLEMDPLEQHPITDRRITSVFVDKLQKMLRQDELNKVRGIAARKRS
jgi:arylsulfatase A-like enzyme